LLCLIDLAKLFNHTKKKEQLLKTNISVIVHTYKLYSKTQVSNHFLSYLLNTIYTEYNTKSVLRAANLYIDILKVITKVI